MSDHGTAVAGGGTLSVEAGDSYFAPTCAMGVPAGTVTLVVRNTGRLLHNVSVPEQGIDQDIAHGEVVTVNVKMDGPPLRFRCKYHWTAGMVGALLPK
jgi:plastocyanin